MFLSETQQLGTKAIQDIIFLLMEAVPINEQFSTF